MKFWNIEHTFFFKRTTQTK